jgi:hypothetical protein
MPTLNGVDVGVDGEGMKGGPEAAGVAPVFWA